MDWFLYDMDLRRERVKFSNELSQMKQGRNMRYSFYCFRKYIEQQLSFNID